MVKPSLTSFAFLPPEGVIESVNYMETIIEWIAFFFIYFSSTKWVRALAAKLGIKREWALTPCVVSIIFLKSAVIYKITGLKSPIYLGNESDLFYYGIAVFAMATAAIFVGLGFIIEAVKRENDPKESDSKTRKRGQTVDIDIDG